MRIHPLFLSINFALYFFESDCLVGGFETINIDTLSDVLFDAATPVKGRPRPHPTKSI